MSQKYIVLGFKKSDDSATVLADPSVPPPAQQQICRDHALDTDFEEVQMFMLVPHMRVFRPKLEAAAVKAEAQARSGSTPRGPGFAEASDAGKLAPATHAAVRDEEIKKKGIFHKTA